MGVVATVAGFSTNSYVTLAEANTYFGNRYDTSNWDGLSTDNKEALLVQAARDIDLGNFTGNKYYDSQSMQFPRDDHETVDGNCASGSLTKFKHTDLKSDTYGEIPSNYWKYGSVHFTSATLENEIYSIASSDVNGFVYADYSATPTSTTKFIVFAPVDSLIKSAQCEQAHYILEHGLESYAEMRALGLEQLAIGDVSVRPRGRGDRMGTTPVMCLRAKKLMSRYFRKGVRIGRA